MPNFTVTVTAGDADPVVYECEAIEMHSAGCVHFIGTATHDGTNIGDVHEWIPAEDWHVLTWETADGFPVRIVNDGPI